MSKRLQILISNDDGINAEGIKRLATAASKFGDVTVVAPASQCSAMSMMIHLHQKMELRKVEDFPAPVKAAYALNGTPADCVKIGVKYIMKEKPDFVFTGMNHGFNIGFDVKYSGTVGAAMEGLMIGIPSAAFSTGFPVHWEISEKYLEQMIEKVISDKFVSNEIWNINFPRCDLADCKGVMYGTKLAGLQAFQDTIFTYEEDGKFFVETQGRSIDRQLVPDGTDVAASYDNYVSFGKLVCTGIKEG